MTKEQMGRLILEASTGMHGDIAKQLSDEWGRLAAIIETPIDMVLFCPNCGVQHIDRPDELGWDNPPHKSHLCRKDDGGCGWVWRQCDSHHTNGVKVVKPGEKDHPVIGGVKPTETRILMGSRVYIDGSQHYRNGTSVYTVKTKARGT